LLVCAVAAFICLGGALLLSWFLGPVLAPS